MAKKLNDVIGAVAQFQMSGIIPKFGRQFLLEIEGVTVRVKSNT